MVLALLPRGTTVEQLASVHGISPGLLSAGMGNVPAAQTYLDITQGNRIFNSLYDSQLPPLGRESCGAWWRAVLERAESAPADIVPGLLSSTLTAAGVGVRAGAGTSCALSAIQTRKAAAAPPKEPSGGPRPHPAKTFEVRAASLGQLPRLVRSLHGDDLLIAVEKPPPAKNHALAVGIAGRGFDGDLTSESTRMDGYVLSTDVAPTILQRLGAPIPSQMSGQPIRAEGRVNVAALASLGARLGSISERRGPVIGMGLAVWLIALGVAVAATGGRAARTGVQLLALSLVYLPLTLLAGGALEPSQAVEQLLVIVGAPLLGLLTLLALSGYRALALASGLTVFAYAIDVVAGSPLTSLSLLGPNPGLGARFYGIGNELEALLTVLVVAGTAAALTGFAPRLGAPRSAAVFLASGMLFAFVFAAGRFGADVGAAIVLPVGGAVAAAAIAARRRRTALLVIAAPFVALALLVLADLVSGANAHLTRSVLDAGGLRELADVAQRRLQLSSHSFARPVVFVFLPLVLAAAVLAIHRRARLRAWTDGLPAMRAGLLGALVATLVGTLANDSGALVLVIGAAYLVAFLGFTWARASEGPGRAGESITLSTTCESPSSPHTPGATRGV